METPPIESVVTIESQSQSEPSPSTPEAIIQKYASKKPRGRPKGFKPQKKEKKPNVSPHRAKEEVDNPSGQLTLPDFDAVADGGYSADDESDSTSLDAPESISEAQPLPDTPPTEDEVRAAITLVVETKSAQVASDLLAKYQSKRRSELMTRPVAEQIAFIAECKSVAGEK